MNYNKLPIKVVDFLKHNYNQLNNLENANEFIKKNCGIINFFDSIDKIEELINNNENLFKNANRWEHISH